MTRLLPLGRRELAVVVAWVCSGHAAGQLPPPPNGGVTPPKDYPLVDNVRGTRSE